MTYKVNPNVSKITSPVVTVIDGKETRYENGAVLANAEFDENYVIASIAAKGDTVVLTMVKNTRLNEMTWIGEEAVSFF